MNKPKKLKTWTIKKAWKTPGPISVMRLYEDRADAEYAIGAMENVIPVSIVVTELPESSRKGKRT
jgi:hypothetical protein